MALAELTLRWILLVEPQHEERHPLPFAVLDHAHELPALHLSQRHGLPARAANGLARTTRRNIDQTEYAESSGYPIGGPPERAQLSRVDAAIERVPPGHERPS